MYIILYYLYNESLYLNSIVFLRNFWNPKKSKLVKNKRRVRLYKTNISINLINSFVTKTSTSGDRRCNTHNKLMCNENTKVGGSTSVYITQMFIKHFNTNSTIISMVFIPEKYMEFNAVWFRYRLHTCRI